MNYFRAYFQINRAAFRNISSVTLYADIELLYFLPSPWSLPQKCEARLDTRIKPETSDVNDAAQVFPPEMLNEFGDNHFERLSMKRVF